MSHKTALITWASSGLGVDFAHQLALRGYHCILVARRADKLTDVKKHIESLWWHAEIIVADLSDQGSCDNLIAKLWEREIHVLINNAGYGMHGDFDDLDSDKQLAMIDLNCRALTSLLYAIGKQMITHRIHGHILNVASTAAFQPWPTMSVYFATKAFVLSLSQAVRYERKDKHIAVSALCPGATKTEFFDQSGNNPHSMMLQTMMTSSEVARQWLEWMFRNQDIIIPWWKNIMLYYLTMRSPRALVMSIVKKMMD